MGISANTTPDSEAKRWFIFAIIGTALYVSAVFAFVITADVEPTADAVSAQPQAHEEAAHGKSH